MEQGTSSEIVGGAGAVYFSVDGRREASICRPLGNVSNNIAEYEAALDALRRVSRRSEMHVLIEMDSLLVCNQVRGDFAVRTNALRMVFREASRLIHQIRRRGVNLLVRHIFREYNQEADALANRGADGIHESQNWG